MEERSLDLGEGTKQTNYSVMSRYYLNYFLTLNVDLHRTINI